MSTNNFSYENICVVVENTGDSMDFDFQLEDWRQQLSNIKGFEPCQREHWTKDEAYIIGTISFYKNDGTFYADLCATYKDGYYSDGCLDYVIEYDTYLDDDKHIKSIEKKIQSKCNAIAKVLRTLGIEVVKVAQFSNGEAVYKAVKKND